MDKNIDLIEYRDFIAEMKFRIQHAQIRAVTKVNQELMTLYWDLGKMIIERQEKSQWGDKVLEQTSKDLKKDFPGMNGFSVRNLIYMRQFALAYPSPEIVKQPVSQLAWGHNIRLMQKVKDTSQRLWYAQKAIENGWSRDVMLMQIEGNLYARQGKVRL